MINIRKGNNFCRLTVVFSFPHLKCKQNHQHKWVYNLLLYLNPEFGFITEAELSLPREKLETQVQRDREKTEEWKHVIKLKIKAMLACRVLDKKVEDEEKSQNIWEECLKCKPQLTGANR